MPVLFEDSRNVKSDKRKDVFSVDVETLVTDVRDRLCLRHHQRYFPSRSKRSSPYQRSPKPACQCFAKHQSSPAFQSQPQYIKSRQPSTCLSCSQKFQTSLNNVEDAQSMLEKLLSEQSLIQEAVRRLQEQRSQKALCPEKQSFSHIDSASNDGYTSYSESEDESLSQHSVDL